MPLSTIGEELDVVAARLLKDTQPEFGNHGEQVIEYISLDTLIVGPYLIAAEYVDLNRQAGRAGRQVADEKIPQPDEDLVRDERVAVIKSAINDLPENQRVAVLLRRYENFSYEEIAGTMNLSVEAVKSLLNRAKENLKSKLSKYIHED